MASASCGELYIGNTINVEIEGLQNAASEAYINDATVVFDLKDASGVVGSQDDVSMPYVADSHGNYLGVLPSTVSLTAGTTYYVAITATKPTIVGTLGRSDEGWVTGA